MGNAVSTEARRRQEVLVRAGLALASELSLPGVLQKIVDLACEVADARYGALGVLGPDRTIEQFLTHGVTEEERAAIGRLPEGKGLLGALIHEATPLRLARIQSDPRSVGFPLGHPAMTSFLGVPVAVHGRVFGNLYLTEKIGAEEFSEADEQAVVQLAAYAGVAVDNARLYSEAQLGRRRVEAVNVVTRALLEGGDPEDVLRLIARSARELADASLATVATPAGDGVSLVVRVADGEKADALLGTTFPIEDSVSGEVMRTRSPVILDNSAGDPRVYQPLVRLGGIGPALFVPLEVRGRVFGTLAVANPIGGVPFTEANVELVQSFAAQASIAIEYTRAQQELQRLVVIEERERIAKELHDDIIQSLFAEGMALQAAEGMVHDPDAMRTRLVQAVDNIDRVIRDLRNYIFGLRPGAMADRQLDGALRSLAASFGERPGLVIEVETDPEAVSVLAGRSADLIQAAREALSNAVRHSGGQLIALRLISVDGAAVLEVRDDGAGFSPAAETGKGHGLTNLRDRATALGGELAIDSKRGRGTSVRIRIPI